MSSPRSAHETDENRHSVWDPGYHTRVRSARRGHTRSFVLIHQSGDLVAAGLTRSVPRPGALEECEYSGIRPRHRTHYSRDPQRPYECFEPPKRDHENFARLSDGAMCQQTFPVREKRPGSQARGRDHRRRRCDQEAETPLPRLPKQKPVIHQPHAENHVVDSNKKARKAIPWAWEDDESSFGTLYDTASDPPSAPSVRCLNTPELSPIRGAYFPDLDGIKFSKI